MPTKLQFYSELAERTLESLTAKRGNWAQFLDTAAQLYKYPFQDQLMIYAQRPDVTACAELEFWNEKFNRWVRLGAKGIALIDDSGSYPRLKYVFDVSDTEASLHRSRPVQLWEMRQEHKSAVLAELAKNYEDIDLDGTLADTFHNIAKQLAREYYEDNYREILLRTENSTLEPPTHYDFSGTPIDAADDSALRAAFVEAISNSIAYTVMARCGLDPSEYFSEEDFQVVIDFNTPDMANALGVASGNLSEQVLRDVEITIRKYERQQKNSIRANAHDNGERSEQSYDRNPYLHESRGLPPARPGTERAAEGTGGAARQVRADEESVPQGLQADNVQPPIAHGEIVPAPAGDGRSGGSEDGAGDGSANGKEPPARQSGRPDGVDSGEERAESAGGGNGLERADLRIEEKQEEEQTQGADGQAAPYDFPEKNAPPEQEQPAPSGAIPTEHPTPRSFSQLGKSSIEELLSTSPITIDEVDSILRDGGNFANHWLSDMPFNSRSSLRIAAHFAKGLEDNAEFLKREYLTGRNGHDFIESGKGFDFGNRRICAWFDKDGISVAVGNIAKNNTHRVTIPWEDAAARIDGLIRDGQYIAHDAFYNALDNERRELADRLWYFYTDDMHGLPKEWQSERGGRPENVDIIVSLLDDDEGRQMIRERLESDVTAWSYDTEKRRSWHNPPRLLDDMHDAMNPPVIFPDEGFTKTRGFSYFITQDEIDALLTRGGNYTEGKFRVLSFFLGDHDEKEKLAFVKQEYGHGGGTWGATDGWHDSVPGIGLTIRRGSTSKPDAEANVRWSAVIKRTEQLIAEGNYMTRAELDRIPNYERLMLIRKVNSFYYDLPEEYERPFPGKFGYTSTEYQNEDGEKTLNFNYPREAEWQAIRDLLDNPERVETILAQMRHIFENTSTEDRYYASRKAGFEALTAFSEGTYTLFPGIEDLPSPETAAAQRSITPAKPRSDMVVDLREQPFGRYQVDVPQNTEQLSLFGDSVFPVLPSVDEQRIRIDQSLQQEAEQAANEAEAQAGALSLADENDAPLLDIPDGDKTRIAEQFADNPRSREAVDLMREIYGDKLGIPLPQAVKRITELIADGKFIIEPEPPQPTHADAEGSISELEMETLFDEPDPPVEINFDAVAQSALERVMADADYAEALANAKSRASLRNPCTWALEQSIRDHQRDEPEVFRRYFSDDDFNDRLFGFVLKQSWEQHPKLVAAIEPEPAGASDGTPDATVERHDEPPYKLRDTFYMGDGKPYVIKWIGFHEISYYSPDTPHISKLMEKADFEALILDNPLNGHLLPQDSGFTEITDPAVIAEVEEVFGESKPKVLADKVYEEISPTGEGTTAYYLFRHPDGAGAPLSSETLALITEKADAYVICADMCHLSDDNMAKWNISFRKMPRDWDLLPVAVQEQIRTAYPEYAEQIKAQYSPPSLLLVPPPLFFVDWQQAQYDFDLSLYNDHDVIGYDKDGVKHALGRSGGHTYVTQTGTVWGDNEVPSDIYKQINDYTDGKVTDAEVKTNYLGALEVFRCYHAANFERYDFDDLADVLSNSLFAGDKKDAVLSMLQDRRTNDYIATHLSRTIEDSDTMTLMSGETADYSAGRLGVHFEILDKSRTKRGYSWEQIAPVLRTLELIWRVERGLGRESRAAVDEPPSFKEQIRDKLSERGYDASIDLIESGLYKFYALGGSDDVSDAAAYIENEYFFEEPDDELVLDRQDETPVAPTQPHLRQTTVSPMTISARAARKPSSAIT